MLGKLGTSKDGEAEGDAADERFGNNSVYSADPLARRLGIRPADILSPKVPFDAFINEPINECLEHCNDEDYIHYHIHMDLIGKLREKKNKLKLAQSNQKGADSSENSRRPRIFDSLNRLSSSLFSPLDDPSPFSELLEDIDGDSEEEMLFSLAHGDKTLPFSFLCVYR